MSTDDDWKQWGKLDPFFGVIADPHFRRENLDKATLDQFFQGGEAHIEHIFSMLQRHCGLCAAPDIALDYGCGVGRLTLPLARRAGYTIGLDISEGMLEKAQEKTAATATSGVNFRLVKDDALSCLPEAVDLINSFIVFQHIPRKRGEAIFARLLTRLKPGGHGAVHFTIGNTHSLPRKFRTALRRHVPAYDRLRYLLGGKRRTDPRMLMETYRFSELTRILSAAGIHNYYLEHIDHGGYLGVIIYFVKPVR